MTIIGNLERFLTFEFKITFLIFFFFKSGVPFLVANTVMFRIGLFRAAHGWGEQKGPLPKICQHISYKYETWKLYIT